MGFGYQEQFRGEREPEEEKQEAAIKEALEIFGLDEAAGPEDIKKAYKRLALKYHPDKNPGREEEATRIFQRLQELSELLRREAGGEEDGADAVALALQEYISRILYDRQGETYEQGGDDEIKKGRRVDIKA